MDQGNPIPDLPLKEYRPVGFQALSRWQRLIRKVNWGHRASFRRAWVDHSAAADGEPVLICSEMDSWHCSADAALIFNGAKPSVEALTEFSDLNVEISDHSSSGMRVFRWEMADLKFQLRLALVGNHIHEIVAVSRGQTPASSLINDHFTAVGRNIMSPDGHQRHNCIHTLWRFLYCVVLGVVLAIPAIIVASLIGYALGIGSLNGLLAIVIFVVIFFFLFLWFNRRQRKYLNEHWYRVFRQGDHDGTVRRALSSVGIELPASNPSA